MNTYYGRKLQKYKQRYNALLGGTVTNEDRRMIVKVLSAEINELSIELKQKTELLGDILGTDFDYLVKQGTPVKPIIREMIKKYGDIHAVDKVIRNEMKSIEADINKKTTIINKINADIEANGTD